MAFLRIQRDAAFCCYGNGKLDSNWFVKRRPGVVYKLLLKDYRKCIFMLY